jgi:hypothetical protein
MSDVAAMEARLKELKEVAAMEQRLAGLKASKATAAAPGTQEPAKKSKMFHFALLALLLAGTAASFSDPATLNALQESLMGSAAISGISAGSDHSSSREPRADQYNRARDQESRAAMKEARGKGDASKYFTAWIGLITWLYKTRRLNEALTELQDISKYCGGQDEAMYRQPVLKILFAHTLGAIDAAAGKSSMEQTSELYKGFKFEVKPLLDESMFKRVPENNFFASVRPYHVKVRERQ